MPNDGSRGRAAQRTYGTELASLPIAWLPTRTKALTSAGKLDKRVPGTGGLKVGGV